MIKVVNLISERGNNIPNQFNITDENGNRYFKSYNTIIAKNENGVITLDTNAWGYSVTTSKYLSIWLGGIKRKECEALIKNGTYLVKNLNK